MTGAMAAAPIRVVIHAGFHKTGTTSLQSSLAAHAAWLAPQILVETRALSPAFAAAADAARRYSNRRSPSDMKALHGTLADWIDGLGLRPGQCLLASSEDFVGHMPGDRTVTDYSAAIDIAPAIAETLRRQIGDGLELTLLYTTRAPEAWLKSIHWQLAKHHSLDLGFDHYSRQFGDAADLGRVVTAVRDALPGGMVAQAALEDLATRRLGPVEAIYDLAPVDPGLLGSLPAKPRINQSPPYDLAEAFMALNRLGIPRATLTRIKRAILGVIEKDRGRDS